MRNVRRPQGALGVRQRARRRETGAAPRVATGAAAGRCIHNVAATTSRMNRARAGRDRDRAASQTLPRRHRHRLTFPTRAQRGTGVAQPLRPPQDGGPSLARRLQRVQPPCILGRGAGDGTPQPGPAAREFSEKSVTNGAVEAPEGQNLAAPRVFTPRRPSSHRQLGYEVGAARGFLREPLQVLGRAERDGARLCSSSDGGSSPTGSPPYKADDRRHTLSSQCPGVS